MTDQGFSYIGTIYTGHVHPDETPIQPAYAGGCQGRVEIFPEYADGLADLEGFSHIYLLYRFHRVRDIRLKVTPFLQDIERGVFATRAPCRPGAIGLSVVELLSRHDNVLRVNGVDMLTGTPLLDIKPYTAKFDCILKTRNGWQDDVDDITAQQRGRRIRQPGGGS